VRFLGHVASIATWYDWCDLLVQPSLGETFGLAMFEAAARHRAVIAVDYRLARALVPQTIVGALAQSTAQSLADVIDGQFRHMPDEETFLRADTVRSEKFDPAQISAAWAAVLAGRPQEANPTR
jgi:glycosyltransferase involved in cell wall biosynthesis